MHRVTYVIGIFGIVLMFDEIYRKYLVRWVAKRETFFAYFYVTVLCLVMLGYKFTQVKDFLNGAAAYGYPTTAVTYLKNTLDSRDGRNIFNWYGWGGYLIWQLPEYKTFIDGRMAVWNTDGKYIMDDYRSMTISPEKNADLVKYYFDRYNIGYVLEHKNSNLIKHLLYGSENGRWAVVNEGPTHTLIRKSAD